MVRISGILNKVTLTFFVGILILFYSCKKDNTDVPEKVYDIMQLNLDTNQVVSSINTYINHPSGCGMIPSPTDSLVIDSLDLNNDLINDCIISAKNWYYATSMSYPCANYCHSILLQSNLNNIQFTQKSGGYPLIEYFEENEIFDSAKNWSGYVYFDMYNSQVPFSCNYQGTNYIGYRFRKDTGYQYGWLKVKSMNNGISIVEGALNRTIDMGIPAGKKVN